MFFALFWAVAITYLNVYAVGYRNRWRRYEIEFEAYSNLAKAFGGVAILVLLGLSGAISVWLTPRIAALPH
jgi:hypothetical protein